MIGLVLVTHGRLAAEFITAMEHVVGPQQRIAGWRLWPEADFPRTHTFKVKRDRVRTWASVEAPLPVTEEAAAPALA